MKWIAEMLLAAFIGAVLTFGVMTVLDDDGSPTATAPTSTTTLDGAGAEDMVIEAVEQTYDYRPEVACPHDVTAERGYVFRCEALVEDRLVPVDVKVVSDLGFLEVVRVG